MTAVSFCGQGSRLTPRELTVLTLVAQGLTAATIARRLGISSRTISKHQENLYRKLEISDRLSAVVRAVELGIIAIPG